MIVFPNCKINLGLSIVEKRADGYHEIESVFYPIHFHDALEIIPSNNFTFSHTGIDIPGDEANNLCIKAYHLLKKDYPSLPNIHLHLHKHIPMGAGLGGGSSDGSAVLKLLNDLFKLEISKETLIHYAAKLGSDCPFFVINSPCIATGRGEILNLIDIDLSDYTFVLVHPGIHISTATAFQQLTPCKKKISIAQIITQPIATWKQELINDFELPLFKSHPILAEIKNELYKKGAVYASMSGSGSSLFGIFSKQNSIPTLTLPSSIQFNWI